uniref:Uncharacterized protein n=1 Tax=Pyrodinium bahamense TaxID=73915 RepID=A0A7S0B4A0_9DINO
MALAERVADMDLEKAQATSQKDREMINAQVIRELGSFSAMNEFMRRAIRGILEVAQRQTTEHFAAVFEKLSAQGSRRAQAKGGRGAQLQAQAEVAEGKREGLEASVAWERDAAAHAAGKAWAEHAELTEAQDCVLLPGQV